MTTSLEYEQSSSCGVDVIWYSFADPPRTWACNPEFRCVSGDSASYTYGHGLWWRFCSLIVLCVGGRGARMWFSSLQVLHISVRLLRDTEASRCILIHCQKRTTATRVCSIASTAHVSALFPFMSFFLAVKAQLACPCTGASSSETFGQLIVHARRW